MMATLSGVVLMLSGSTELSLIVKATVLLIAALAGAGLARRARASVRHVMIATSFAALIALPILITVVPAIAVEVPATTATATAPPVYVPDVSPVSTRPNVVAPAPARIMPRLSLAQW